MAEIKFPYDRERAWQTILWFANAHGGSIDLLKLVKLIFYADREHLVRYGRPITGGIYRALPLGPVAVNVLDDLNAACGQAEPAVPVTPGFSRSGSLGRTHSVSFSSCSKVPFWRDDSDSKHPKIAASAHVDESLLSESDFEVLEEINRRFGYVDPIRLSKMTHDTKAYKKNFKEGQVAKAFSLPYEDFFLDFPTEKRKILTIIKEDAEARACLGS